MKVLVTQSCPSLGDPMGCSLSGSSVRGVSQTKILEWAAIPFSRRSSWPRDRTQVSWIAGKFFTIWATIQNASILLMSPSLFLEEVSKKFFCYILGPWGAAPGTVSHVPFRGCSSTAPLVHSGYLITSPDSLICLSWSWPCLNSLSLSSSSVHFAIPCASLAFPPSLPQPP